MKMGINELFKNSRSVYRTTTNNLTPRVRRVFAWVVAAFAAVALGVANQASADRSPVTCTTNGSGAAISKLTGAIPSVHGDEICYVVEIFNTCGGCCDVTELDTELVLPDGSIVPVTIDATVLQGDDFLCPSADPRCATSSNCTIPGEVGYRYIVAHVDEHGATGGGCPPTPAAGSGEVSAFLRSTDGTVHLTFHVGASLCKAITTGIAHACCEPCSGTCTDVYSVSECPFPSVFTPDMSCAEVSCTPLDCSDLETQCNDAMCDLLTGTCVQVPKPPDTPCELDKNLCTVDLCDGAGVCVANGFVECLDPTGECDGGSHCETATGNCVEDEDQPLSTPCNTDDNLCTGEHCDGLGFCIPFPGYDVACDPAIPPCEGGELCDPATGDCVAQDDAALSTPCEAESPANLCTNDHCDGLGNCTFLSLRTCPDPAPPCEGGANCNPSSGLCVDKDDAPLSTPCETDIDPCTNEHCDGLGLCVILSNKCAACCDHAQPGGVCVDGASIENCSGPQLQFFPNETCAEVDARGDCNEHTGACCDGDTFGDCQVLTESACNCSKCEFYKDESCEEIVCMHKSIPTVSQWGLVVLTLFLLTGAKVYFGRRQANAA